MSPSYNDTKKTVAGKSLTDSQRQGVTSITEHVALLYSMILSRHFNILLLLSRVDHERVTLGFSDFHSPQNFLSTIRHFRKSRFPKYCHFSENEFLSKKL